MKANLCVFGQRQVAQQTLCQQSSLLGDELGKGLCP